MSAISDTFSSNRVPAAQIEEFLTIAIRDNKRSSVDFALGIVALGSVLVQDAVNFVHGCDFSMNNSARKDSN